MTVADELCDRVAFLTATVGLMLGAAAKPTSVRARLRLRSSEVLEAEFSVRAIPLKKSGIGGLCWLVRPAADRDA